MDLEEIKDAALAELTELRELADHDSDDAEADFRLKRIQGKVIVLIELIKNIPA